MRLKRRVVFYCMIATGICVAAQIGSLFCFFTYQIIGKYIYLPFVWLSDWPNTLLQPFFPKTLPSFLDGMGWPISCFISLVGWVALGALSAVIVHSVLLFRRTTPD
jgi:hypothetical protein